MGEHMGDFKVTLQKCVLILECPIWHDIWECSHIATYRNVPISKYMGILLESSILHDKWECSNLLVYENILPHESKILPYLDSTIVTVS